MFKALCPFLLFVFIFSGGCRFASLSDVDGERPGTCAYCAAGETVRGALLGTRFRSLDELKSVIEIHYVNEEGADTETAGAYISHCSNGLVVHCALTAGVSQGDIWNARYDKSGRGWMSRLTLLFRAPWVVRNRGDLQRAYTLSRWRPEWFGEGDVAFYDLAKATAQNINTAALAFKNERDSTEKGYLNSFNHIGAQAFITSIFSEEMADFIADAHERYSHPELLTGQFTEKQIADLNEGPVDNYVDLINNEWGQQLGKQLKAKFHISRETVWTPALLACYLNALQSYYSWAFQTGFKPFRPEDEIVIKFSAKLQKVMGDVRG